MSLFPDDLTITESSKRIARSSAPAIRATEPVTAQEQLARVGAVDEHAPRTVVERRKSICSCRNFSEGSLATGSAKDP